MTELKRVLILPRELLKSFEDWQGVRFQYTASCYCTSITTDMESYIEVEALELDCLEQLCRGFQELGFEFSGPEPERKRVKNETSIDK